MASSIGRHTSSNIIAHEEICQKNTLGITLRIILCLAALIVFYQGFLILDTSSLDSVERSSETVTLVNTSMKLFARSNSSKISASVNSSSTLASERLGHSSHARLAIRKKRFNTRGFPNYIGMPWSNFVNLPKPELATVEKSQEKLYPLNMNFIPIQFCSQEMEKNLSIPLLSQEQAKWCRWAVDKKGGQVAVGKSWGLLKSRDDRVCIEWVVVVLLLLLLSVTSFIVFNGLE